MMWLGCSSIACLLSDAEFVLLYYLALCHTVGISRLKLKHTSELLVWTAASNVLKHCLKTRFLPRRQLGKDAQATTHRPWHIVYFCRYRKLLTFLSSSHIPWLRWHGYGMTAMPPASYNRPNKP